MPRPAAQALRRPATASGTQTALYRAAQARFCRTTRTVRRASSTACTTAPSWPPGTTKSALACASGTACPKANDTWAPASTGPSLRPSPTIATRRPACCSRCRKSSLFCGVQAPACAVIPSAWATLATASGKSPDNRWTEMPAACRACTVARASARRSSCKSNVASQPWASAKNTCSRPPTGDATPQNAAEPRRRSIAARPSSARLTRAATPPPAVSVASSASQPV